MTVMGVSNTEKQEASRILAEQIAEFKTNGGVVRVISREETDAKVRSNKHIISKKIDKLHLKKKKK